MTHKCPVAICKVRVSDDMLMCRPHWFMVPKKLRDVVWETYRSAPHSLPHVEACQDAIRAVNVKIGNAPTNPGPFDDSTA